MGFVGFASFCFGFLFLGVFLVFFFERGSL